MQFYAHKSLPERIINSYSNTQATSTHAHTTPRHTHHDWDNKASEKAMQAKKEGYSYRRAAAMYAIPTTTLYDHMSGKVEIGAWPGPKPYLNAEEEEEKLASFLVQTATIGYPHSRGQLLALVQQIVDSKSIKATVTNGWWERFVNRHPKLCLQTGIPLSLACAMATDQGILGKYFDILEDCLVQNGIFDRAAAIFNCDETGLPLNPACGRIISEKGCKNPSLSLEEINLR